MTSMEAPSLKFPQCKRLAAHLICDAVRILWVAYHLCVVTETVLITAIRVHGCRHLLCCATDQPPCVREPTTRKWMWMRRSTRTTRTFHGPTQLSSTTRTCLASIQLSSTSKIVKCPLLQGRYLTWNLGIYRWYDLQSASDYSYPSYMGCRYKS